MLEKEKISVDCDLYFVNAICKSIEHGKFIEFFDTEWPTWTFEGIRYRDEDYGSDFDQEKSCLDYNIGETNSYNRNATFLTLEEAEAYLKTLCA